VRASGHKLGFAVKVLGDGGLPSHDSRRWQSGPHLRVSLERLRAVLAYLDDHDIRMYRMATALAPYASHPDLPQFHGQVSECEPELAALGARAQELDIRLSSHPGQYTVLNSEREEVARAAAAELEVQASLFNAIGLGAESVAVVHVGGTTGGLRAGAGRFERGCELLSDSARARIAIENDDRSYPIAEVVELARRLGIPAVFDPHHHRCLDPDGISDREAVAMAAATWRGRAVPKVHFSSPRLDLVERRRRVGRRVERTLVAPDLRRHADLIDPMSFELFCKEALAGTRVDVMLEAKGKDLALLRLREQMLARGHSWRGGRLRLSR
jgi:UV DNA damage endonuclease